MDNFKDLFESRYTWIEGYMRNVRRYSRKLAIIDPASNRKWTYAEFNDDVNRLTNTLVSLGIGKKEVVMLDLLNCPEFAFAYVATQKIHAVCCPVSYRLSPGELADNIEDSHPKVIIFDSTNESTVLEALTISGHKPEQLVVTNGKSTEKVISYKDFVKDASTAEYYDPTSGYNIYDETTRLYTSGTTGRAKGVSMTSINEVLSAHDVMIHFPMSYRDVTMNTTPWFHRGGLHCAGPGPALYAGATMVVMSHFDALKTLQYTWQYQRVLTPNIYNGYGTTETFWNTFLRPFDLPENAGTAGASCVDDDVRVVKVYEDRRAEPDELIPTDSNEVGEVIICSPAKSPYLYFNNDVETEKKYYKGFIYTNDLATWDENQFITIVGRKDDMIISSGENIYPTEIEAVLNVHPKVKDCIVTSVPDKIRGQVVTAYIVKNDDSLTPEELDDFCKESPDIANFKRPRFYRFIPQIPFNATGKKMHVRIKETAAKDLKNGLLYRV